MTPDQAQYYLLMLRMGEYDEYDRELDRLLEEQDPLSELVLELAFCMSDRRETISVLHNFLLDHPADEEKLMQSQLDWVRTQYREKAMTALQAAQYLDKLTHIHSGADPWWELYAYMDDYELYKGGFISLAVFEKCFDSYFLHGIDLDPWQLQQEETRQKSLLGRLRDLIKPTVQ